jgi:hypothetical protein
LGGFFGGWLSFRRINKTQKPVSSRIDICLTVAPLLLLTAVVPFIHSAPVAAVFICLSFFLCMTMLSNLHSLPLDIFGAKHAAFTASALTFSYALLQTILSPAIGAIADRFGFAYVCVALAGFPFAGALVLRRMVRES